FARDLDRTLELQPIHARRPGAWFRTRRLAQRHPGWAASILFLGLLLVGVPSGLAMVRGRHVREMQDRYDEIRRLSDAKLVRDAIESEHKLHPCVAEQVRPMGEWVNGADELLHRRGDHVASRARVAARIAARAGSAGLASPEEIDADRWQLEVLDA